MPEERAVAVGRHRLRCTFLGPASPAGPPVLLLHGGGSGARTWGRLGAALAARGHRVVAPDLRGHGGSSRSPDYPLAGHVDDVVALLDALAIERLAGCVGHSLGGHVALGLARGAPGRVARLVVEEPGVPARRRASVWRRAAGNVQMVAGGLRPRRFDLRVVASAVAELREPDPGWWAALPGVTVPTLLVTGGRRSHVPQDDLAAVAALLPDCEHVAIPVGHRVHSHAPERFAAAVLGFLPAPSAGDAPGGG